MVGYLELELLALLDLNTHYFNESCKTLKSYFEDLLNFFVTDFLNYLFCEN